MIAAADGATLLTACFLAGSLAGIVSRYLRSR